MIHFKSLKSFHYLGSFNYMSNEDNMNIIHGTFDKVASAKRNSISKSNFPSSIGKAYQGDLRKETNRKKISHKNSLIFIPKNTQLIINYKNVLYTTKRNTDNL